MINTEKKIVDVEEIKKCSVRYRREGRTIVFTNGCFDILHWGHVSYLQMAKKDEDRVLVVGLNSDRSIRCLDKGKDRPIISQDQRSKLLAAMGCVDHVVIFDEPTPEDLIKIVKPDILVKGADWKGKLVAGSDSVKASGGRVEFIEYIEGFSTTAIIKRIKESCPSG